ncbi:MAG: sulfotransferase family 2 domain-containing protein [Halioglobus sp.]|nr:sulfotransferase family 2 domain-containing protein [Halioglobus sp.]
MIKGSKDYKHYFSNKERTVAYLNLPKCGCSSIKTYLASFPDGSSEDIHSKSYRDKFYLPAHQVQNTSVFTFTFVRSPQSRFLSFYKDKILRWDKNISVTMNKNGFSEAMSIDQTIDVLFSNQPEVLEPHIRPMSLIIYDQEGYQYAEYIGKLETFRQDITVIEKRTKVPFRIEDKNVSSKAANYAQLTELQEKRIREFFDQDYQAFGY